jgi:hypothetical protein
VVHFEVTGDNVEVQAGAYPLASYGSFKFKTDPVNNTYQIYGGYGVNPGSGTYVYTAGESGRSTIVFQDALGGSARSQTLSWDTSSAGAYVVRDSATGAYQAGTFRVEAVSLPPVITSQPGGITLNAGATGVLSVVASSTEALTYQWRKGGVAISGATGSSLVIGPAQSADAGSYSVAVTSGVGTVLSNAATVKVNAAVATGVAPDSISGRAVELTVLGASFPFEVGEKYRLLLSSSGDTYGIVDLSGATTGNFGQMTYRKTGPNSGLFESTYEGVGLSLVASVYFTSNTTGFYTITEPAVPGNYETGAFRIHNGQAPSSIRGTTFDVRIQAGSYPFARSGSFKLKTDAAGNTYQIYGGSGVTSSSGTYVYTAGEAGKSSIILRDSITGESRSQTLSWDSSSTGAYVVSDSEYGAYQAGEFTVEAVSRPPVITTQPSGLTLTAGATAALSVVASSTDALLVYQWRKDGVAILGATAASLLLSNVSELSAGSYDVLVTNASGSVTSAKAGLKVIMPVTIVRQPNQFFAAPGKSASLSVSVTGTPPFTFRWRKDGVVMPAATSGTLFFSSVTQGDFGSYVVEVANSAGSATSAAAAISLGSGAVIAAQPVSVNTRAGAAATFAVVAKGTEPISYQWRKNGVPIPEATRSSYTVPVATALEIGAYEVFAYNEFGSATSSKAMLDIAGNQGISLLTTPRQPVNGTLTLVKGTAGSVSAAIDPVDTQTARTTYQLLRFFGGGSPKAVGVSALVPSSGTMSVPLRSLVESGTYALEYIRQYTDGSPAVKVVSEPFSVEVLSFDSAAGVYEMLLGDSNQAIPDGATYRGALQVTVAKSGSVSGKLIYNEAPELYGAADPSCRVYTPVTRAFTGVFATSQTTNVLVCHPKLGVGAQVGRQRLSLELDFTTSPVSLRASVVDRISVPAEIAEEGALSAAPAVARNLTKLAGMTDIQTADMSTAVGRYNIGSSFHVETNASPGLDRRALILTQILASGRVLWASRIEGHSGSGTAGLRLNDEGALVASFFEGRQTSTTKLHHSNSLAAALQLDSLPDGRWTLRSSVGPANGFVERQSSHVTKSNGRAEYTGAFEDGALETKDFNWSCAVQLDLSAENFCVWNGGTKAGLFRHFSLTQADAAESTPRQLTIAIEDPAEGTAYSWRVSMSSTGAVRVTPQFGGQPNLTLRFDKLRGEFSGSYIGPSDKLRRTMIGVAILDPAEELLRAHGWVELNAIPATKTAAWKLELAQP